ncbi:enoyl-CoA hydratase [Lampropedia aestuarii]|uniref:Enoyl-CoA hydratase domain-containing protein 3, mitochondrial n=1 Tax=Lampropedia aestuarii TaxID=2562762 RepID=A0A4S5BUU8_9BURK|nr:enoyl-CoA hydratase [Lampropedia aestuarii]MDH5858091.1 enoyl-CoA hydratase [Lampropedia aestuarii]THJ33728.1 enoyl-CoA hydratase [Lampropedia aestuarii]
MSDSLLNVVRPRAGVVEVVLNDPGRFNALGGEMLEQLIATFKDLALDESLRAVVIAGNGKAFCAGHNLKDMAAHPELQWYQALFAQCTRFMLSIHQLPVPVVAKVQGIATAAGCQLVAQCDLAVASEEARFAVSGIQYGLFCSTPSVPLVRNVPLKKAMEMLVTGEFVSAQDALQAGLLNRVVASDAVDAEVERLLDAIVAKPRISLARGKALLYAQKDMGLEAAYQLAAQTMAINMMDAAAQEGAQAFAQKRPPRWE